MKSKKTLIIGIILTISIVTGVVTIVTIKGKNGSSTASNGAVVETSSITSTNHKTTKIKDSLGNIITVPKGFVVVNPDDTVQDGIVISDMEGDDLNNKDGSGGNQFVWIPVGKVIKKDKTETTIELGRYEFPYEYENGKLKSYETKLMQSATNYEDEIAIEATLSGKKYNFKELKISRKGNSSTSSTAENATAKDLSGFIKSVQDNGGYYISRYLASNNGGNIATKYNKKKWKSYQREGALAARTMYSDTDKNTGVESDLINSYAYDTAIVYMHTMENLEYEYEREDYWWDKLTGENGQEVCRITDFFDTIWTTESIDMDYKTKFYPNVWRGIEITRGNGWNEGVMELDGRWPCADNQESNYLTRVILYVK